MTGQDWLTVEAAAQRLGVSQDAVRSRIKRGTLPAIRRASRVFVVLPRAVEPPSATASAATNPATNPAASPTASPTANSTANSAANPMLERLGRLADERQRQIAALRSERDRLAEQVTRQQQLLEREQRLRERLQDHLERLSQGLSSALPEAASDDPVETADQLWRRLERQVRRLNQTDTTET